MWGWRVREGGPGSTLQTEALASAEVWRGICRSRQNRATVEDWVLSGGAGLHVVLSTGRCYTSTPALCSSHASSGHLLFLNFRETQGWISWWPHIDSCTVLLSWAAIPSLHQLHFLLFGSSQFTLSPTRSWCHPTCPETQIRENTHSQFNWQLNRLPYVISVKTTHNYYRVCLRSPGSRCIESDNYWALIF